jgi:hypothetical protein
VIRRLGHTLAVPQAALQHAGGDFALAFETPCWAHFTAYVAKIERLPPDFVDGSACVARALEKVREELWRFGSPARLRQLLCDHPGTSNGESPPAMLYAGIVWWIEHLQESAASVTASLHELLEPGTAGGARRESLQLIAGFAARAMLEIGPLLGAMNSFKLALLSANGELADACDAAERVLQQAKDNVGALRTRILDLEARVSLFGLLATYKKDDLLGQLDALHHVMAGTLRHAGKLSKQLGALDTILDEGAWIEAGLDDLIDVMDQLRLAWTRFGSGVAQLAVDASAAELAKPPWSELACERSEAIRQWDALGRSACQFAAESLCDFSDADIAQDARR